MLGFLGYVFACGSYVGSTGESVIMSGIVLLMWFSEMVNSAQKTV